jgi:hypothetical protein
MPSKDQRIWNKEYNLNDLGEIKTNPHHIIKPILDSTRGTILER